MQQQTSIYFEVRNRKPTITPTRTGGNLVKCGWQCVELRPNCALPHRGKKQTLHWHSKTKMQEVSLPAIVRLVFNRACSPSRARGCQSNVQFAVKGQDSSKEYSWGIVHTVVVGCSQDEPLVSHKLEISVFLLLLQKPVGMNDDKKTKCFCQEESGVSITFFLPSHWLTD